MQRQTLLLLGVLAALAAGWGNAAADPESNVWTADIPAPLVGPYIIDPATLIELDAPGTDCAQAGPLDLQAGPLNFQCLVFLDPRSSMTPRISAPTRSRSGCSSRCAGRCSPICARSRPQRVRRRKCPRPGGGVSDFAGARIELVGVINRMDRQFNRDKVPSRGGGSSAARSARSIGLATKAICRAARLANRSTIAASRTMNVVFPARPWSRELTCPEVAQRWLDYARDRQPEPIRPRCASKPSRSCRR